VSRLLIIACSSCKSGATGPLAAIDRYDGPAFKVLRKYLRENPNDDTAVLILSAKFGLIPSGRKIPDYDVRMTEVAAARMRAGVLARLRTRLDDATYLEIGLCLGRDYLSALTGYEAIVPAKTKIVTLGGGLGSRLTRLREWLRTSRPAEVASK
jgi:hypothetical protein